MRNILCRSPPNSSFLRRHTFRLPTKSDRPSGIREIPPFYATMFACSISGGGVQMLLQRRRYHLAARRDVGTVHQLTPRDRNSRERSLTMETSADTSLVAPCPDAGSPRLANAFRNPGLMFIGRISWPLPAPCGHFQRAPQDASARFADRQTLLYD